MRTNNATTIFIVATRIMTKITMMLKSIEAIQIYNCIFSIIVLLSSVEGFVCKLALLLILLH
jgi:hypothetical protein